MAIAIASTGSVFALGLGEVSWKSTLNQPLNAEIALYDIKNVTTGELVVELADAEAFEKAGLERPYFLSDLVFTPVIKNGKGYIKITSHNPIKEPYLDFLLSVSWASGKTLREYTLLIDPPTYAPKKVIATIAPREPVKAASQPKADQPKADKAPDTTDRTKVTKPPVKAAISKSSGKGGNVTVSSGDSLWAIAARTRGNASIHQAMISIYQENQDAFIDGDMSRLKRGKVLRIPNAEQMRTQTRSEALAQVLQNVNNKGKAASRQVVASNNTSTSAPKSPIVDQLTLVAPSDKTVAANQDAGQTSNRLLVDLSIKRTEAEENLEAINRKNEELRSRMQDLQSQLSTIKGIIELRDNQLASLQANIAKRKQSNPTTENEQDDSVNGIAPQTGPNTTAIQ